MPSISNSALVGRDCMAARSVPDTPRNIASLSSDTTDAFRCTSEVKTDSVRRDLQKSSSGCDSRLEVLVQVNSSYRQIGQSLKVTWQIPRRDDAT